MLIYKMTMTLEREFTMFLWRLADQIKKDTGYNPTAFRGMVEKDGGQLAAKNLINRNRPSEGYVRLFELGRLDFTLEAQVLANKKYHSLFTEKELTICKRRLKDYEYDGISD